ncbi:hypothetical protein [Chryseobacterium taklimakanense]|uniref:DUF4397 domain-containing protein n=1 Tax=Chryseobacterium taklimakanense TaxID=536441 RepID=A0A3G8WR63_9FLAO|nr:hypothetical protein [Chryseobacterium taklimakanense]AZI20674.1 hypothetical protein EIH08_08095 [Chryseobacterium taklimakanense]
MKKTILALVAAVALQSCNNETLQPFDIAQKPASIEVKGYSKPDSLQMKLNGNPVLINEKSTYAGNINTKLEFVLDEGETNFLTVNRKSDGKELAKFEINYKNLEDYKAINFYNLPGLFLQTAVNKPTVNLGRTGFMFIFPNLGELSKNGLTEVKGVLRKANGDAVKNEKGEAVVFEKIGRKDFTDVQVFRNFTDKVVYLDLYKPGESAPYATVELKNGVRYSMIVLQEMQEKNQVVVKGDINVADYL